MVSAHLNPSATDQVYVSVKNRFQFFFHAEKEKERLIDDLQKALASVKKLSSMLPICASCKKIKDNEGYWEEVASYITRHTDTLFSHGMCPECEDKAMQELEKYRKENT